MTFETTHDGRVLRISSPGASVDDDVDSGQLMLVMSKRFANQALQVIALDGTADDASGNRQPQASLSAAIAANEDCEETIGETSRILIDAVEIRFVVETLRRCERPKGSRQVRSLRAVGALRRLRPSNACDLWRDDGRALAGLHVLPCAHESRAYVDV